MRDRSCGWIKIGGNLRQSDIHKLATAIESDAALPDWNSARLTAEDAIGLINDVSRNGQPLQLIAEDTVGGELDRVEAACRALALTFAATWEAGCEYPEGARFVSPEQNFCFGTSGGEVSFTVAELRQLLDSDQPVKQALARLQAVHEKLEGSGLVLKVVPDAEP